MIKVIASDMDGTLLGDDHKIAPQTLEAIHRACDSGIRFMIATGRNFDSAMQVLDGLDLTCDYVVGSGSEVRNPQKELVSKITMSMDLCREVYETMKKYPISVIFCTDSYDYQIGTAEEIEESMLVHLSLFFLGKNKEEIQKSPMYLGMKENTKVLSDFRELKERGAKVHKIFLFAEDLELLKSISDELSENPNLAVASSFVNNLEITDVRAQKGPVLKSYIESLGYTMDEVMVLGDSLNDYSMLSMDFGATVAMENSVPEIKEVAKYITKSNEEFGVAHAIYEVLKQQS